MRPLLASLVLVACTSCSKTPPVSATSPPEPKAVSTTTDPLGERPSLAAAKPFRAPKPEIFTTTNGTTVWLLHRPELPIVSLTLSLPVGSANDPKGQAGLASITASMLDEGAGERGAIAISTAIDDLGGSLSTGASLDGSRISLMVLRKHLDKAFPVFADVIARPTFLAAEWKRITELWFNQLERRSDNPAAVASVLTRAVAYGRNSPYGHPPGGMLESAKALTLAQAKAFYQTHYRPDAAHLVVAGAIDRTELEKLLQQHLSSWKRPATAPATTIASPKMLAARPKLVLVDRPKAPQSMVVVLLPGIAAQNQKAAPLALLNTALGGSFTSRLNQNLREDKAWTYGAGSAFQETRGQGCFIARAAVKASVTGPAVEQMLHEIRKLADGGLTSEELRKVRARDLLDLVETNETITSTTWRLSTLALLGLSHDHDAVISAERQRATRDQLAALAKSHFDVSQASVIVVGPAAQVSAQLKALDLGPLQMWTANGQPQK